MQKVVGPDGKVVFDETGRPGTRVLDPDVAACEVSILHGRLESPRGTASGKGIPGHDAFGKTGTNDNQISSAFLGGTPDLVSFVWHGVPEEDVPGAGFGAGIPNTIWRDFMIPATLGARQTTRSRRRGPRATRPGKVIDPVKGRTDQPALAAASTAGATRHDPHSSAGTRARRLRPRPLLPPRRPRPRSLRRSPAIPAAVAVVAGATGSPMPGSKRRFR